jgi:phosphoribosylformylglycinamidine synthase
MATVRVLVLRAPGINCDEETAYAWTLAGAHTDRLHVRRLIERPDVLGDYQVLTIPGGFSYGDDIASGRILAGQLEHHLGGAVRALLDRGGLVLGICNGFQVLVRMRLLPGPGDAPAVSLTLNDSGRYEDRWVRVRAEASNCPFLAEGEIYHLPVAHAEGKLVVARGELGAAALASSGRIALQYVDGQGDPAAYPENPNGSIENAAALVDDTGRVLGLMPHPERHILPTHAPCGNRPINPEKAIARDCDGLRIFRRAVRHLS